MRRRKAQKQKMPSAVSDVWCTKMKCGADPAQPTSIHRPIPLVTSPSSCGSQARMGFCVTRGVVTCLRQGFVDPPPSSPSHPSSLNSQVSLARDTKDVLVVMHVCLSRSARPCPCRKCTQLGLYVCSIIPRGSKLSVSLADTKLLHICPTVPQRDVQGSYRRAISAESSSGSCSSSPARTFEACREWVTSAPSADLCQLSPFACRRTTDHIKLCSLCAWIRGNWTFVKSQYLR